MPSPEAHEALTADERSSLAAIARASLREAVEDRILEVEPSSLAGHLAELRASFVTLERGGELRGCIGSIEARRPLGQDVARNTFAAAREDFRFPPVGRDELTRIEVRISALSPMVAIDALSPAELEAALRPGVDGVLIADGGRRATFLPTVWEQLAEPSRFLAHLLEKAGLPARHWSPTLRAWRYTVESIDAGGAATVDD